MSDKRKWGHNEARAAAEEILAVLRPVCSRIEITGSLRCMKPTVGDAEILYVPRIEKVADPESLLGEQITVNLADEEIARLELREVLARRMNVNGSATFGEKIKLMVLTATGFPIDLFSTTEASWWNYLVCRTGPKESNIMIATAAQRKGWKWEPYSPGFYRIGHTVPMHSEEEVFRFVGLKYKEPQYR